MEEIAIQRFIVIKMCILSSLSRHFEDAYNQRNKIVQFFTISSSFLVSLFRFFAVQLLIPMAIYRIIRMHFALLPSRSLKDYWSI